MGEDKDPADDANVRVNIGTSADESEEWENDFGDGPGPATAIDPDALKKLRRDDSASESSGVAAPDAAAEEISSGLVSPARFEAVDDGSVDEFDDQSVTVMDSRASSESESSGEGLGAVGVPCPKCGVKVAPGYPKCPRCKAVLMQSNKARPKMAGGTSVMGRTVPWTIVVIAAILTAIIYYLAEREPRLEGVDDDTSSESQEVDTAPSAGDENPGAQTAAEDAEEQDDGAAN